MPDIELSVTICSWNTLEDTRLCLQSLRDCKDEGSFEVLLVDNASIDGSADMVALEFPEVRLLRQTTNLGFTGGHNLAIRERIGKHVALLNSDTIVHKGAIREVLAFMASKPEIGVVGPKLLNPDESLQLSCRRFPNPLAAMFRNTPLGRMFPKNKFTREYLMTDWDHTQEREVDWVSGAAMFISHECVDQVGVLDNTLFMFCEDVDYCKRAWEHGFKVAYFPNAVITHAIGRSTDKAPVKGIIRFHRSMYRYYRKHDVRSAPLLARPFLLALAATALTLRATVFLVQNLFGGRKV